MRGILPICLLLAGAGTAFAQGTVVVPNALANVEGNSSMGDVFSSPTFRLQMVIDASQFAIPPGASGRVNSIWFRLDSATTATPTMFFGGGSVTLSTIPVGPDGLSSVFADNVGANAVTIFNGAIGYGGTLQPGSPQPFVQTIIAASPFWYVPSQGNLLLDIRGRSGQAFFPGALDAQSVLGDSVSRVFALNELASSGAAETLGLVTRFDMTVVPEPSAAALLLVGAVACGLMRYFRKSRSP